MGATAVATQQPNESRVGRPSKLTPATRQRILDLLKLAHSQDDAAILAGIGTRTMTRWLARGRQATSGEYYEFWRDVELAASEGKSLLIKRVIAHTPRKPELALKVLARRWPKEWGPKASLEIEQKETPDVAKAMEVIEQRLAAMEERKRLAAEVIETVPGLRQIADQFGEPEHR